MRECSGAVFSWIGEPPNTPLSLSLNFQTHLASSSKSIAPTHQITTREWTK